MCILFIGVDTHPNYPLIVCANRDEFHHRGTEPAHFWPTTPIMLAGKDKQAGGTWLGINNQGAFAGLTNIRNGIQQDGVRSRGELVVNALTSDTINHQWLVEHGDNYNPFNLVYQQNNTLLCFNSSTKQSTVLAAGFHAISNGLLDDIWPKMATGLQQLEQYIHNNTTLNTTDLIAIMQDQSRPQDHHLPSTGLSVEWERLLSSIFIQHPEYGTRSTSIILRNQLGETHFIEVRYDGKARNLGSQQFTLVPTSI